MLIYLDIDDVEDVKIQLINQLTVDHPMESTTESTLQSTGNASTNYYVEPPRNKRNIGTLIKDHENASEEIDQTQPFISREQQLKSEFQSYIQCVSVPTLDFEENPLQWWKLRPSTHPILATFAKKIPMCLCNELTSERLFSSSGHIISPI